MRNISQALWPDTRKFLRAGFKHSHQELSDTEENLAFACVHFSAAAVREAAGVPAAADATELARCIQGSVLCSRADLFAEHAAGERRGLRRM